MNLKKKTIYNELQSKNLQLLQIDEKFAQIQENKNICRNTIIWIQRNPSDLKCKPIIAGPLCPTNRLNKLIYSLLQPFLYSISNFETPYHKTWSKCTHGNIWCHKPV